MDLIGIDVGGTKILGVHADERGTVLDELRVATRAERGVEAVIERIARVVEKLTPAGGVAGIGIGMPGPLDHVKGEVYSPPNLPGWVNVPIVKLLRERLALAENVPLVLVNDANAAALGEYVYGAGSERVLGRRIHNLVYFTISTGIGGGIIADGRLLTGANGLAAEMGHMVVDAFGRMCNCGNIGCLEAMASGTALAREAAVLVASTRETLIDTLAGGDPDKVTAELVSEAAREGDPLALELMEREGKLVGMGVVSAVHIFNPELVVLGGGVTNAGDLLFNPVRETVARRVQPAYRGTFDIVPAALGGRSGALGAVAAAALAAQDAQV
ncbi:MAG TPA: ROK family protein [Chloroflexia bacterium]|nr:ROK family protein [Chloroflexia bacterium]